MLPNPIVAILYNQKTKTWHPLVYEESPLPGQDPALMRHKSTAHHTQGFAPRDRALKEAERIKRAIIKEKLSQTCGMALGEDILWDGEDLPISVAFFKESRPGEYERMM